MAGPFLFGRAILAAAYPNAISTGPTTIPTATIPTATIPTATISVAAAAGAIATAAASDPAGILRSVSAII